jgi:hypothetical protein
MASKLPSKSPLFLSSNSFDRLNIICNIKDRYNYYILFKLLEIQMKNRLLAAILTLATVPFFASATTQQATNAQLVTHLKQVKAEVINMTQQLQDKWLTIDKYADTLPNDKCKEDVKHERQNRDFALKIINEFYDNSALLQQMLCDRINEDFNLLCNNMISINQLPNKLVYIEPVITEDAKKQLYQELEPIFAKHHQQYCIDYPNGELIAITAHDAFEEIVEIITYIKEPNAWIQKIDIKIAELEIQL